MTLDLSTVAECMGPTVGTDASRTVISLMIDTALLHYISLTLNNKVSLSRTECALTSSVSLTMSKATLRRVYVCYLKGYMLGI